MLTGRSHYLHSIGKQFNPLPNFPSLSRARLISLNNLSCESIRSLFEAEGGTEWISKEGNLEALHILTGGIPRVVVCAACFLRANPNVLPMSDELERYLKDHCSSIFESFDIDDTFRHLVEISWAGIEVDTCVVYNNVPLSAILARFGLNTSSGSSPGCRLIEVSLYLLRSQRWATGALRNIAQYRSPGDRIETGYRRVLFLRLSVLEASNWAGIGLGFLDSAGVPYLPDQKSMNIFNLPKFSGSVQDDIRSARDFMCAAHTQSDENGMLDPDRTMVSSTLQPFSNLFFKEISELMQIGQFYLPLPQSSSADATMRVGQTTKLHWQFKNCSTPISNATMENEAELCAIPGWRVYLVIFCTKGNENGSDCVFAHRGVNVIALSQQSVSNFLGPELLLERRIQSTAGLASDQHNRPSTHLSPLKRKFKPPVDSLGYFSLSSLASGMSVVPSNSRLR